MLAKSLSGAAAAASPVFVEDTFSTYLYTGNGSTQTITNGIDLSGKGGLVWIKGRSGATGHRLTDTVRGATKSLVTSGINAEATETTGLTAFGGTGFTIGDDADYNTSTATYVSWAFREQAKFFDVVTYTGNGIAGRTVSHNLGSVPGCILVKRLDASGSWRVYHRSLGNTQALTLNTTDPAASSGAWNNTTPSATTFTLGNESTSNASGGTYVAYLFAHDAGGFGLTGADNVISCGSYAVPASAGNAPFQNLGWEPQWILVKSSSSAENWELFDNMRGLRSTGSATPVLLPNSSAAEASGGITYPDISSTGFKGVGSANTSYIYIAIRRGPMKVPTVGTSVFSATTWVGDSSTTRTISNPNSFVIDGLLVSATNFGPGVAYFTNRLTSPRYFETTQNYAESTNTTGTFPSNCLTNSQTSFIVGNGYVNTPTVNDVAWMFRRAPGFFDVVCDTGTGSSHTITHNLGAVPELMIRKKRSAADAWIVYANNDNTDYLVLNTTAATVDDNTMWNDTSPTYSVFTVGTNDDVNGSGATFVTYLFASVAGVSKVGSYTGTGTTKQIDCGFTGGARFVLIKRTDSTGDWYIWDSARGIVAGNDPYLLINTQAAEVTNTDYIDTYSAGFEISSTAPAAINANGGTFIFLAIA